MKQVVSTLILRASAAGALALGLWLSLAPPVQAKGGGSLVINGGQPIGTLRAGPDFATDVLADPWDFNNREDVTLDPNQIDGFSNFAVSGGFAGGTITARTADGGLGGSYFHILTRAWDNILNPGRNGRNFPIDTTIYTQLSFKLNMGGNSRQIPRIGWFHGDIGSSNEAYGERLVDDVRFTTATAPPGNGIYTVDLPSGTGNDSGVPWSSGAVKGLRLYPNSQSDVGYTVQYDWVRLTTAATHPAAATKALTWSPNGGHATIVVNDGNTNFTVATNVSSGYVFNYGVLPPGTYTLTITDGSNSGATSFTINTPPLIHITDPDETGGQDFATTELNNPWDMTASNDIIEDPRIIVDHLASVNFTGGILHAQADSSGDPEVYLLANAWTSQGINIDTTKYHRLTFDLQVDGQFNLTTGSIARVFWGSDSDDKLPGGKPYENLTTSKDIITWPGRNTYSVDLAPLTTAYNGGLEPPPQGQTSWLWTQKAVRHLRIDPFEMPEPRTFHIDNVKLAADDETFNNKFAITWTATDPDAGQTPLVTLYYDTDKDPTNKTLIVQNVAASAGQYVWNTAGMTQGTYYIYAVITDGINATAQYSTGPVKVSNAAAPSNPVNAIDAPVNGSTVTAAFEIGGWAIDTGAPSGTGVDGMQFYIRPNDGADPAVFLGTGSIGAPRADIGSLYGTQFTNSGYHFTVTGMTPGKYLLEVYAHSSVSNTYSLKTAHITVNAQTLESIDIPSPEAVVSQGLLAVGGWAIDRRSTSGVGVDVVSVYAYPNPTASPAPAPIDLGGAFIGIDRPDVQSFYGTQFLKSGYVLNVDTVAKGLTPGLYNIAVWAHSSVDGSFNNVAVVRITIQ